MMYDILPNAGWIVICGRNEVVIASLRRLPIGEQDYVADYGTNEGYQPYQDSLDDALSRRVLVRPHHTHRNEQLVRDYREQ